MVSIIGLGPQVLKGMATAIAISNCRSGLTGDASVAEDEAAGMLPDSKGITVRLDR